MKSIANVLFFLCFTFSLFGQELDEHGRKLIIFGSKVTSSGWESFKLYSDSTFENIIIDERNSLIQGGIYDLQGTKAHLTYSKANRKRTIETSTLFIHSEAKNGELTVYSKVFVPSESNVKYAQEEPPDIKGRWQSFDDPEMEIIVNGNRWLALYNNQGVSSYSVNWRTEIPELIRTPNSICLVTLKSNETGEFSRYIILDYEIDDMTIMHYPSGKIYTYSNRQR